MTKKTEGGKWIYRYSFSGRRREMGLGSFPEVSLADARKERSHWQRVLQRGQDPISERNRIRYEEIAELDKEDPTFEEMAYTVFDAKKAALRNEGSRGKWFSCIKIHLIPKVGKKRMSEIHQRDIYAAIKPIWSTHNFTAKRSLARARIIFEQSRLMGCDVDPFTVDAARHMLGHFDHKTVPIPATLWQEVPDLFARLDGDTSAHRGLRWQILTATRGSGARGAKFEEVEDGVWTIPAERMKGRKGQVSEFRVPLSDAAMELYDACAETTWSDLMFPNQRKGYVTVQAQLNALGALGEEGRPHGFRTSFRTWVQDTNAATFDVAETALAHRIGSQVERSYARSDLLDQRRILMQKWSDFVMGVEAKVVRIRGG